MGVSEGDERESANAALYRDLLAMESRAPDDKATLPTWKAKLEGTLGAATEHSAASGAADEEAQSSSAKVERSTTTRSAGGSTARRRPVASAPADTSMPAGASRASTPPPDAPPSPPPPSAEEGAEISVDEDRREHAKRIIFFERLYFMLDLDGDGAVPIGEVDRFLTFAAYDLSRDERQWCIANSLNVQVDSTEALDERTKAELVSMNRREFVQLCVSALLDRDMEELQLAAETFWRAQKINAGRAQKMWRRVSYKIDVYCRTIFSMGCAPLHSCCISTSCAAIFAPRGHTFPLLPPCNHLRFGSCFR